MILFEFVFAFVFVLIIHQFLAEVVEYASTCMCACHDGATFETGHYTIFMLCMGGGGEAVAMAGGTIIIIIIIILSLSLSYHYNIIIFLILYCNTMLMWRKGEGGAMSEGRATPPSALVIVPAVMDKHKMLLHNNSNSAPTRPMWS